MLTAPRTGAHRRGSATPVRPQPRSTSAQPWRPPSLREKVMDWHQDARRNAGSGRKFGIKSEATRRTDGLVWQGSGADNPLTCGPEGLPMRIFHPKAVRQLWARPRQAVVPMGMRGGTRPTATALGGPMVVQTAKHTRYVYPARGAICLKRWRRHPSPWLSSHKLGRPFGLANPFGFEAISARTPWPAAERTAAMRRP